jgi:NADH-ubiquinone oxidoreductase chain 2
LYACTLATSAAAKSASLRDKKKCEIICKINLIAVVQLISQLKGYFYINPLLSLSLAITIFSFVGIPPLVGFFAKQMVLSAALDNGYIFLSLIAILTSVIGAVYYLNVIKEIFFYSPEHVLNPILGASSESDAQATREFKGINIFISSPFSITISIITLVILLFIFLNKE